jgi:hypothetical protein
MMELNNVGHDDLILFEDMKNWVPRNSQTEGLLGLRRLADNTDRALLADETVSFKIMDDLTLLAADRKYCGPYPASV